jgi:hypothetical protein
VHAALEFGFHLAQLRLQPFANRLPQHREAPITPLPPTDVCEAQNMLEPTCFGICVLGTYVVLGLDQPEDAGCAHG